jgi:hypothetical protein
MRGFVSALVVLIAAGVAAPAATGQDDIAPYERFEFSYTSQQPGASTGFRYRVRLATEGNQQPPVVRELRLTFHPGTRIDTGAVPACTSDDAEILERGTAACPRGGRVATGEAGVYVGAAAPLELVATVFSTHRGVVAVLADPKGAVVRVLRGTLSRGRVLVVPIPAVPLGGGKEVALVRFELDIPKSGTARRPWARTPKRCGPGGWRTVYAPRFDTLGRVELTDTSRCRRR